jgi:hypothetical protein
LKFDAADAHAILILEGLGGPVSTSPRQGRNQSAPAAANHEQGDEVSRRAMLSGAAAMTAAAAVGVSNIPVYARTADPNSSQDMMAFLVLSSALTGVGISCLAPEFAKKQKNILDADPGVDPFNIKEDYFNWINAHAAPTFEKLLQIAREHLQSLPDVVTAVNASDDTKFLARSIVLLWYLGSWYEPDDLKKNAAPIASKIVSPKAYTLGLVWQIAQAHPMGYSNLQFGYWSREPGDPNDKSSHLGCITDTLP